MALIELWLIVAIANLNHSPREWFLFIVVLILLFEVLVVLGDLPMIVLGLLSAQLSKQSLALLVE